MTYISISNVLLPINVQPLLTFVTCESFAIFSSPKVGNVECALVRPGLFSGTRRKRVRKVSKIAKMFLYKSLSLKILSWGLYFDNFH